MHNVSSYKLSENTKLILALITLGAKPDVSIRNLANYVTDAVELGDERALDGMAPDGTPLKIINV